ncbi:uncharacterized protein LOC111019598 [Momordica charantia]|uniref:Uncharacterized protein LOC111019598 n=1 Tax=Momordica charantia TaxID=3673 RepID=A0A6J1DCW4_MOMCH|nr:uncharacterized protein LOC111019598 [Momordica charantia]
MTISNLPTPIVTPPAVVSGAVFTSPPLNQLLNQITSIKMDRGNFLLWQNLALPILRSYKLFDYLTGDKPCPPTHLVPTDTPTNIEGSTSSQSSPTLNPTYEAWIVVDKLLLGWLYNSMAADVAMQVMGFSTSRELWTAVQELFGVQSRAEVDYLKQVFQQTCKGSLQMIEYLKLMKSHADNLALAGSSVSVRDLVSQVLTGLDEEYNPIVVAVQGKVNLSWSEMHAELLTYEKRLEYQNSLKSGIPINQTQTPSVNYVDGRSFQTNQRTNNGNNSHGSNTHRGGGYQRGSFGQRNRGRGPQPTQHKNFTPSNSGPNVFAAHHTSTTVTTPETVIDPSWYADSGATSHVTANPNNVEQKVDYSGTENVIVANGNKLSISHIGSTNIHASGGSLKLKDVLRVPDIAKNLDKASGRTLLKGTLKDNLYRLDRSHRSPPATPTLTAPLFAHTVVSLSNNTLSSEKPTPSFPFAEHINVVVSTTVWHKRLGHPSIQVLTLQSDGGGEYQPIHSLCRNLGIQIRVSYPYTSAQNGRAERKHRHIVETGLTLLAQASMSLNYWWDVFLTATLLINSMPMVVLKFKSPMEALVGKQLDLTSVNTFGCACFLCLRPYHSQKF